MAPRKTAVDPFADEAQTDTPKTDVKDNATVSTENNNTEVSATFKGGTGFESPWLVVRATDLEAMDELLSDRETLQAVLAKTWEHGKFFTDQAPSKPAGAPAAGKTPQRNAPSGPSDGTPVPDCEHGEMVYKTGVTKSGPKAGETWKAFMCPAPQGSDQCKPIWK